MGFFHGIVLVLFRDYLSTSPNTRSMVPKNRERKKGGPGQQESTSRGYGDAEG